MKYVAPKAEVVEFATRRIMWEDGGNFDMDASDPDNQ